MDQLADQPRTLGLWFLGIRGGPRPWGGRTGRESASQLVTVRAEVGGDPGRTVLDQLFI